MFWSIVEGCGRERWGIEKGGATRSIYSVIGVTSALREVAVGELALEPKAHDLPGVFLLVSGLTNNIMHMKGKSSLSLSRRDVSLILLRSRVIETSDDAHSNLCIAKVEESSGNKLCESQR